MARKTYPGTLARRGDTYLWRWQQHGKRVNRTFKTKDRNEAIHQIRKEIEKIEAERQQRSESTVTMKDLLDDFEQHYLPGLTSGGRGSYKDSLGLCRAFFVEERANPAVGTVRRTDVQAFVDWCRALRRQGKRKQAPTAPPSQRTLRRHFAVLHTLFQFACENRELRPDNPCVRKLRPKRGDERQAVILSPDDVERLLKACEHKPMLKLFVLVNVEAGLRPNSETLWLRWEDVDLERKKLHVVSGRDGHRTKTGKSRTLPLTDRLTAALKDHAAAFRFSGSPWIFHHVTTQRHHERGARLASCLHAFQNAAKRGKLPAGVRPYDLRHTRLTRWAASHPLPLVQKAAGHSSIKTTMGYVHLQDEDLNALISTPSQKPNEKTG